MSKFTYDWKGDNIVDDVKCLEADTAVFKELLSEKQKPNTESMTQSLHSGYVLQGQIIEITKDFVVIDVGLKSEGLVSMSEFTDPTEMYVGSMVEVFIDPHEGEDGQIVLSREKARRLRLWEEIVKNCVEGSVVSGKVMRKVKGGLMVDIGVEAFLPGSQIDNQRIRNLDEYVDKTYKFKILKINTDRKNIIVSRRELLEEERMNKRVEMLQHFHEGELRQGIVKNITDFGVFLDVDGVDALLHITDMTWKRIKHPSEMVRLGDQIEVIVLHVDKEKGRVALGMKQKEANPWEEVERLYPAGSRVRGKVVSLVPYGAFVEIAPGIEGLVHISEISWSRVINDPSEILNKGDEVEAIVLGVQKEEGKISLGMKQLERNPWDGLEQRYPIGCRIPVEVRNLTNYGAFVEVEPGVDGFIHTADLSWTKKFSHPSELLKRGDKIDVAVLSIDLQNQKVTLGIKQLEANPWENIETVIPVGAVVKGVVSKITAFGAFVELENGLEGLIHVTELSDQSFSKVEEVISQGEAVEARVIHIDHENRKISLSIRKSASEEIEKNGEDVVVGKKTKRSTKKKG